MEGISHIALDDFDVWCLEDGTHTFEASVFPGCAYDEQQTRLAAAGETEIRTVFNAYLIKDKTGALTLVDTGCGEAFGGTGGALAERLSSIGVAPATISRLVFTHLHADHCGGAFVDGNVIFPNADVFLHPSEQAHWAQQESIGGQVLSAYGDRINLVDDLEEILPGLTVWSLPGHTPGHIGLRVGDKLALVGDVMHAEALQIGDPRLGPIYDVDPPLAVDSRLAALGTVADMGLIWSGSHMLGPDKFARLVQIGDGFIRVAL